MKRNYGLIFIAFVITLITIYKLLTQTQDPILNDKELENPSKNCITYIEITGNVNENGTVCLKVKNPKLSDILYKIEKPNCIITKEITNTKFTSGDKITFLVSKETKNEICEIKKTRMNGNKLLLLELKININKANKMDLSALPGIGPTLAERIINHRKENGNFKNIEELSKVKGIAQKKLAAIHKFIKFSN